MAWSNTPSRTQLLQSATKAASELSAAMITGGMLTKDEIAPTFETFRGDIFDFMIVQLDAELAVKEVEEVKPRASVSDDPETFVLNSGKFKGKTLAGVAATGQDGINYIKWYATSGKGPNKTVEASCTAFLAARGL